MLLSRAKDFQFNIVLTKLTTTVPEILWIVVARINSASIWKYAGQKCFVMFCKFLCMGMDHFTGCRFTQWTHFCRSFCKKNKTLCKVWMVSNTDDESWGYCWRSWKLGKSQWQQFKLFLTNSFSFMKILQLCYCTMFVSCLILLLDILHNITLLSATNHCFKIAVIVTFVVGGGGGDGAIVRKVIILYPSHLMCQYFKRMFKDLSYTLYLIHINQSTYQVFSVL